MNDSKYLYGASVQGIQDFIFQTGRLAEIVGASELVEQICTTLFQEIANPIPSNIIINAAGNIKYIFDDEQKCKDFVRKFPKAVMSMAPGITISQAVVPINGNLSECINGLEIKLKTQRNKVEMPFETGFMGLERSRRTGGVAFVEKHKEIICEATALKLKVSESDSKSDNHLFEKISGKQIDKNQLPLNISEICGENENNWLAVVHADGNGIGLLVQKLAEVLKDKPEKIQNAFSEFSKQIDFATKKASREAFEKMMAKFLTEEKVKESFEKNIIKYPIRPILLGGDDITIIIRADLALEFTKNFLIEFEKATKSAFEFLKNLGVNGFEEGITACAGIAYIKKAYPFHYGVHLAEDLCADAKKFSKSLPFNGIIPKSSFSFYKVQESFIEDLEELKTRTLFAKASDISFAYGPYLIHKFEGKANIDELESKLEILEKYSNDKTKSVSKLRKWISELFKNKSTADFMLTRIKQISPSFYADLKLDKALIENKEGKTKTILYDLTQLHSLKY